ncbi:hypothetical protein RHRU231_450223 [Rhodococcus ruber]|uniref:Uncharacterized protein n=1 Tax=Rhodococcus ruber TaxID=1830 RepID=A0A098BMW1_9NOCA|nr:hypothetical protein RHRU231_450223 [Rhodococcus ruber]
MNVWCWVLLVVLGGSLRLNLRGRLHGGLHAVAELKQTLTLHGITDQKLAALSIDKSLREIRHVVLLETLASCMSGVGGGAARILTPPPTIRA